MNVQGHHETPQHPGHDKGGGGPHHKPDHNKPDHHKPVHHKQDHNKPAAHKPAHHKPAHHKPNGKKTAAVWELDLTDTPAPVLGLKQGAHIH